MKSFFLIIGSLLVTLHGLAQDPREAEAKLEEQLEDQAGGVGGGKVIRGFLVLKKTL